MASLSLPAKKSLGQHFLTSPVVPDWMCDAAEINSGETVLEIGPGTGVLTRELLARGALVIAVEADQRALAILADTFSQELHTGQLTLHHTDVRTGTLGNFIPTHTDRYKVVANIPYYLSGLLFRTVLTDARQPSTVVFLVQKEVAKRAHSNPNKVEKQSLLSLSVRVFGSTRYVKTVTRGHFTPPPRVDSAIIAIDDISRNFFTDCDELLFFNTIRLGFGNKRKQLLHNLATQYNREVMVAALEKAGIDPSVRAEDLALASWKRLVQVLPTATQ